MGLGTRATRSTAACAGACARREALVVSHSAMEQSRTDDYLARMDSETRDAIAALSETMKAGFARADHYFELQQLQFVEWRAEVRGELGELRQRVDALSKRVDALSERLGQLEHEVMLLRDYVTREIADIRVELRELHSDVVHHADLRREVGALSVRIARLEQQQRD